MILATISQIITQAQAEYESKRARRPATAETAPAEAQTAAPAAPVETPITEIAPVGAVPPMLA
jgi:hypothetical protein